MTGRTIFFAGALFAVSCAAAQKVPEVKPTFKFTLVLPVTTGPEVFGDITETIGQLDLGVNLPLFKGLGIGVGGKGTYFTLDERGLASVVSGDVTKFGWYGKLQYEQYTAERNYYEFSAKVGQSYLTWNASTCEEDIQQTALNWSLAFSYYIHATENLAFGLLMGFESDQSEVYPQLLCLDSYPGRTERDPVGPLQFLSFGLGFSTLFSRAPDRPMGTF